MTKIPSSAREILEERHLYCCGGDYCDWKEPFEPDTEKNYQEQNMEHCLSELRKMVEGLKKKHKEGCFQDVIYQKDTCACGTNDWNSALDKVLERLR